MSFGCHYSMLLSMMLLMLGGRERERVRAGVRFGHLNFTLMIIYICISLLPMFVGE